MTETHYPYACHDDGIVLTQDADGFHRRPMTEAELAARAPALAIAKDIYRHANQAGVCYVEIWRLIADAIGDSPQAPIVRIKVEDGAITSASFYMPGLPDGEFDLWCDPR